MTQTFVEQFVSTPEGMRLFQQEQLILDVTEMISATMEEQGLSKADLAARLHKSRAYVTQLLDGRANMTLRTISDVFLALGKSLDVVTRDLSARVTSKTPPKPQIFSFSEERELETGSLKAARAKSFLDRSALALPVDVTCEDETPATLRVPA
jgi:transcriptional regulator with XRE-family HTH domain